MTRSNSKPRANRLGRSALAVGAGVAIGLLAVVPLPYYLIGPGHAIDLATRITVEGRPASSARFFLTDVSVVHATALDSLTRFLPATEIVPASTIMPGGETPKAFDRAMDEAMSESQNVASYVAERAAGLAVRETFIVRIGGFAPNAPSAKRLHVDDRLLAVGGKRIRETSDVARAVVASGAHTTIAVTVDRGGKQLSLVVPTMHVAAGARRLGVFVRARLPANDLPVPVRFAMDDVAGASAGLMFALQIYADLRGVSDARTIAGTGTIAPDGTVGPIEGTRQKYEAARRAGATVFFVPLRNVADLANTRGSIAIVSVRSFDDALDYLKRTRPRAN